MSGGGGEAPYRLRASRPPPAGRELIRRDLSEHRAGERQRLLPVDDNHFCRSCSLTFTALLPLGPTSGRVVTVTGGATGSPMDLAPAVVTGSPGLRQSFRVGIATTQASTTVGVGGMPGRTVNPARGDLWLLGCEVR